MNRKYVRSDVELKSLVLESTPTTPLSKSTEWSKTSEQQCQQLRDALNKALYTNGTSDGDPNRHLFVDHTEKRTKNLIGRPLDNELLLSVRRGFSQSLLLTLLK